MAYGFYVTNRGLDKIGKAAAEGSKVSINQYAVGNGGVTEGESDPNIIALNSEVYRKTLDDADSYAFGDSKLQIKVRIPSTAPAMTFNEVGYFDTEDELIIYGTMGSVSKGESTPTAPQVVEHENYIALTSSQLDRIEIVLGSEALDNLNAKVREIEENLESNYVPNERWETLKTRVVNNENTLKEVQGKTTDLEPRVKALEDTLVNLAETLEVLI